MATLSDLEVLRPPRSVRRSPTASTADRAPQPVRHVLRHSRLASIDAARLRFADIVLEPLPTLVRDRTQDHDGPVVVDLDVLPVGHVPKLAFVARHRQRGQRLRHRSNSHRPQRRPLRDQPRRDQLGPRWHPEPLPRQATRDHRQRLQGMRSRVTQCAAKLLSPQSSRLAGNCSTRSSLCVRGPSTP